MGEDAHHGLARSRRTRGASGGGSEAAAQRGASRFANAQLAICGCGRPPPSGAVAPSVHMWLARRTRYSVG